MGSQQVFCLRWSNHQSNMLSVFDELLQQETLVDVTLACDGLSMKAHKVVLSACSPYFQTLFVQNPCKHPIVILKDIRYTDLRALIDFMYKGEVNVTQEQLSALLKTAEALKIKGLTEVTGGVNGAGAGGAPTISTPTPDPAVERTPRHGHRRSVAHHPALSGARVERTLLRGATSSSPPQNLSTVDRRLASATPPPPPTPQAFAPGHQMTPPSSASATPQQYLLPAHQRPSGQDLRSSFKGTSTSTSTSTPPPLPPPQTSSPPPTPHRHSRSPSAKRKRTRHHHHHHRRRPSSEGGAPQSDDAEGSENLEVQGSPEMIEAKVEVGEPEDFDPAAGGQMSDEEDEPMDQPSGGDTDSNQESLDNFYTSQGPSHPLSEDYGPIGEPMPAMPISLATPLSLLQKLRSPGPSTSSGGMVSQADLKYFEQSLLEFTAQAAASASDNTCPVCGITFRYRNNLYRHRRTHCDTRVRHGCQVCGKTFSRKDTLQLHARVKHQVGEHLYPVAYGGNSYEVEGDDSYSKLPDDSPKQLTSKKDNSLDLTTGQLDLTTKQLDLTTKQLDLTTKQIDLSKQNDLSKKVPDKPPIPKQMDLTTKRNDLPTKTDKTKLDEPPKKPDATKRSASPKELDLSKKDDSPAEEEEEDEEEEEPEDLAGERK